MKNEKLLIFLLAFAQFTHIIDFMIIMPLGSTFMEVFEISPRQFSFIVSIYAFSAFFSGIASAMYVDRYDRKKALLFVYAGFTLGTVACALAPNYHLFIAARALAGAFGGIISALILSVIGDVIPLHRRGAAMGLVMTAFSVASIIGVPSGIFLAASFGWRMPFIAISLVAIVVMVALVLFIPEMKGHIKEQVVEPFQVIKNIFKNRNQQRALIFTVTLMFGHFIIIPFIAPYMQLNIGLSDYQIGYMYLIGGTLTAILLPIVGKLSDRYGHARIFSFASVFALFSIFFITNLPPVSIFVALCATSTYFIASSGRSVPATTLVTSVVKSDNRASFMSIRTSANELALALSSTIAGLIISENPDGSLNNYEFVGYLAIIVSIIAIGLCWRLKAVA